MALGVLSSIEDEEAMKSEPTRVVGPKKGAIYLPTITT